MKAAIVRGGMYHGQNRKSIKLVTAILDRRVYYIRLWRDGDITVTIGGGNSSLKHFTDWAENPVRKRKPFVKLSDRKPRKKQAVTIGTKCAMICQKGNNKTWYMNFAVGALSVTRSTRTTDEQAAEEIAHKAKALLRAELKRDKYDRRPVDDVLQVLWSNH